MTPVSSLSSTGRGQAIDSELDLHDLLCVLWRGQVTVRTYTLAFALGTLTYSCIVRQEWIAIATTDEPIVNIQGGCLSQQQFSHDLDVKDAALQASDTPSIAADEAYQEFLHQLAPYNNRRNFWIASPYYQACKNGDTHADTVLLDELINAIQLLSRDKVKKSPDREQLVAGIMPDANQLQLLRRHVYANQRAANHLNKDIIAVWAARIVSLKKQMKRQEAVAAAVYQRKQQQLNQLLKLALTQDINNFPQSKMFLLGYLLQQACLHALQTAGPGL